MAGLSRSDDDRIERLDHENDITIRIPPPIAIASSSSAIGRSLPPVVATSLVRSSVAAERSGDGAYDASHEAGDPCPA